MRRVPAEWDEPMDEDIIQEVLDARARAMDDTRPEAVAKVHAKDKFTARERIDMVLDEGSFVEYGVLAIPANKSMTGPADGLVQGFGTVDGHPVGIASYDYTVQGGTQTALNHGKFDRLLELVHDRRWPLITFADGGGARAHDLAGSQRGLTGRWGTFDGMAVLSGWVPTVSVVSGRSFAGNASIAGLSDFIVATRDSAIGMGGPPLVEGAMGLKLTPDEIGPAEMHDRVGGIDLMVETEAEAIDAGGRYLRYFLYDLPDGEVDPWAERIRGIVPSNRRRAYDMRRVIRAIMDRGSVFELRPTWAPQLITALARLGGRSVGIIANQPLSVIAGAIDSDASDKIARFIQLCDAHEIAMVSLVDNPGYMVGRPAEEAGIARHHARPIIAHQNRTVPLYTIQLRKAYGLGPAAMGNSFAPRDIRLAWPTAESGGMGLEGASLLVNRDEIREVEQRDPAEAKRIRDEWANDMREHSSAINAGRRYEFDDVIAPEETRDVLISMMKLTPRAPLSPVKKHAVDAW